MRLRLDKPLVLKIGLTVAVAIALWAILLDLESSTRGWDAYGELVGVQRASLTDQPFYVGATDQKGPLWLSAHAIAYHLGGMRDAWWFIAAMWMLCAGTIAFAAMRFALVEGRDRLMAGAAAIVVFVNLTLNREEWGHVLYSRNIVSFLFACALALLAVMFARSERTMRRTLWTLAGAGVLTGFAVQTNIASAPTAVVFTAVVAWLSWREQRSDLRRAAAMVAVFTTATAAAFISALVWYTARGAGDEFIELWWNYNRQYVSGTGVSTIESLRKGVSDFNGWYQDHPVVALVILGFVLDWGRRARKGIATVWDAALVGWWLAECLAVALAQRFFDAYLILPFVPVAFMGVTLAGRYGGAIPQWARPAAAAAFVLLAVFTISGQQTYTAKEDVQVFERLFQSPLPADVAATYDERKRDDYKRLEKLVDRYSDADDWVFAWTGQPETYYAIKRREATRLAVNQWLWGVIPQGDIAPRYVLKDAWKLLAEDFKRTPPELWIEQAAWRPVPPQLPLAKIRDCGFKLVHYDRENSIYKRSRPIGPCLDAADLPAVDAANAAARKAGG